MGSRVVVDTDTGIDDALALLVLAAQPDVELVAVGTTHGNCATERSTANARRVLDVCGLGDVPVVGGLSAPLSGALDVAWFIHGHDGLGDCGLAPEPAPPAATGDTAVELYLRLAAEHPGELDLVALGPLTNLGAALRIEPELLTAFRTVTIMGGTGPRLRPGDPDPTHGVGDPNTYHDAEAARLVAAAPGDVTLVGVDVTMGCVAPPGLLDRLASATTEHGRFAAAITRFYVDAYESRYGERRLTLHDPLTAMVAVGLDVGATFVSGPTAVEGPAGHERVVLVDDAISAPVRRVLGSADITKAAGWMAEALD
jgi:purine nucleosidase